MALTSSEIREIQWEVLRLINEERKSRNLCSVRLSDTLSHCARYHTRDQMRNIGEISHTGSRGSRLGERLRRCHYEYERASENVASGQLDAEHVVRALMESAGHRDNILEPNVVDMGVWVEQDQRGRKYWTQLFGMRYSNGKKVRV